MGEMDPQGMLEGAFWGGTLSQRLEAARGAARAGAKLDAAVGADGSTLLMRACASGQAETVRILLEIGADPMARRSDGACALWVACAEHPGHHEAVEALMEKGADPRSSGPGGADVAAALRGMPGRGREAQIIERFARDAKARAAGLSIP